MDKATRDFFKGVKEALRAFGRESDGPAKPSAGDPVGVASGAPNPAAAHPDLDTGPDCPQCKMPWAFHPTVDGEAECHAFPEASSPAMKDVVR